MPWLMIQYLGMWVTWERHSKSLAVEDFTCRKGMQKMKRLFSRQEVAHQDIETDLQNKERWNVKSSMSSLKAYRVWQAAVIAVGNKTFGSIQSQWARTKQTIFFSTDFQMLLVWHAPCGKSYKNCSPWSVCPYVLAPSGWSCVWHWRWGSVCLSSFHSCSVPCSHLSVRCTGMGRDKQTSLPHFFHLIELPAHHLLFPSGFSSSNSWFFCFSHFIYIPPLLAKLSIFFFHTNPSFHNSALSELLCSPAVWQFQL